MSKTPFNSFSLPSLLSLFQIPFALSLALHGISSDIWYNVAWQATVLVERTYIILTMGRRDHTFSHKYRFSWLSSNLNRF